MDRRVTPPKQVTSPTWGPPPPCKQALRAFWILGFWETNFTKDLEVRRDLSETGPALRQPSSCEHALKKRENEI